MLIGWEEGGGGRELVVSCFAGGASARGAGDGFGRVVLEEGLQEHAHRAENAHKHKDPQEESVDHHGNILPVLAHLWKWEEGGDKGGGFERGTNRIKETSLLISCLPPPCSLVHSPLTPLWRGEV